MNPEIMSLLLALTIRGTVILVLVWLLDRAFRARMSARSRRAWWFLVPVSFLFPTGFPILPSFVKTGPFAAGAEPDVFGGMAAADAMASRAHGLSIVNVLAVLWLVGAIVYLLVVGVRTARASRHWSRAYLSTDSALTGLLEECKGAAGITAPIGIVVSDDVPAPALFGWLRPRIMLPASLVAAGREARHERLRGILLHELAHFRALDIPLHWLQTLACAVHWFNPLAHMGVRAWMRFREEAADECAIAWLGRRDATEYGEAFVEALKHSRKFSLPLGALVVGESNKNLKQRMIMILNNAQKTPRVALALVLTIGLAAAAALLPVRAADPQPAGTTGSTTVSKQNNIIVSGTFIADPSDIGQIFALKDLDQKPQPRGRHAEPQYPLKMKRAGITGEVTLQFIIDTNGDAREVTVIKSTHREFEEPSIQAVQQWKFHPGKKGGKNVNTRMLIPIAFNLGEKG